MKKNNKAANNNKISNIQDWVIAVGNSVEDAKKYETSLIELFNDCGIKLNPNLPVFCGSHKQASFTRYLFNGMKMFSSMSFVLVVAIITYIVKLFLTKVGNNDINSTTFWIKFGLIVVGYYLIKSLIKYFNYKSKINQIDKLEIKLTPIMQVIPKNYRNSAKMALIPEVAYALYSNDMEENAHCILPDVDHNYELRNLSSPFIAFMYDLPCTCPWIERKNVQENGTTTNTTIDLNNNKVDEVKYNPYLPGDMDDHICEGSKDADKDLADMIGLNVVKDQVEKFKNRIKFFGEDSNNGCHLAFYGSAGTGKTTVARIVTKILFDLGYIKKNEYVEISGDYLTAGNTSRANAIIERAFGGVLFIDEAYLMAGHTEVIGVLLKAMEDHRKDFVCILAGYEDKMTHLFACNEGFTSRVKHNIYFPDYTEEEMVDIFNYFTKDYNGKKYTLSSEAIPTLIEAFAYEKKSKSFGNARTVRNAVDAVMDNYVDRVTSTGKHNFVITLEDVKKYAEERKPIILHEIQNSSSADHLAENIVSAAELKQYRKDGSENPEKDMNNLVGLDKLNDEIKLLEKQKEFYGKPVHQKIVLIGKAGCGKSTAAKILTGALYKYGYIEKNSYIEMDAKMLEGQYLGHTVKRANAIISYAAGGVIVINNYNALFNADATEYDREAADALNKAFNENEDVTFIITDEESNEMNNLKAMSTMNFVFPDYTANDLVSIFEKLIKNNGYTIQDKAMAYINWMCTNFNVEMSHIQNTYTNTAKKHIMNYNGDEATKFIITAEDLDLPVEFPAEEDIVPFMKKSTKKSTSSKKVV